MAGYASAKACCESFLPASRRASANYCIGKDGEIWLNVDERNRAWTSGNSRNDNAAITIECANYMDDSNGHVYGQLPQKTWDSLVALCADICLRNGISECTYTGHIDGVLTKHKWFQSTDCPGPWLDRQFDRLAHEVNELLGPTPMEVQDNMTFLFTTDAEQAGKVFLYDGARIVHVSEHEKNALMEAHEKATGNKMPFFNQNGMSTLVAKLGV